ncbi:WxL domain-containing protein [Latilactobacillus sakei]|uniref:WxL domain-containing protein n=1 Tax=Latilactobacillus sakei TaxID=1599 RepID=UPI001389E112|nr:WxL domain-containing protein [Latilactobacillus sakei]
MKISTLLLSGLVTVAGAAMISGQTAFAADAPKNEIATDGQKVTSVVKAKLTGSDTVKLTAVPDLDFGTKEITASVLDLGQTADGTVSVADAGYTVDVALTTPFTDASSHILENSTLTLKNASGISTDNAAHTVADTKSVDLTNDSAKNIITAGKDQGLGNWNYKISGSNLHVLAGAYAGDYTGQLTWTLTATPKA